jgi:glucokinase
LTLSDVDAKIIKHEKKVVIGPGTGVGEAILHKSVFSPVHEVLSSEGAHVDFSIRSEEDFRLAEFTKKYVETSNNVENQCKKRKIDRVSVEQVVAGPAITLLYEFMKQENP